MNTPWPWWRLFTLLILLKLQNFGCNAYSWYFCKQCAFCLLRRPVGTRYISYRFDFFSALLWCSEFLLDLYFVKKVGKTIKGLQQYVLAKKCKDRPYQWIFHKPCVSELSSSVDPREYIYPFFYWRMIISSLKYRFSGIYVFKIKHCRFFSTSINYVCKRFCFIV